MTFSHARYHLAVLKSILLRNIVHIDTGMDGGISNMHVEGAFLKVSGRVAARDFNAESHIFEFNY